MASFRIKRLPGISTSLFLFIKTDHGTIYLFFFFFSVWMWTVILRFDMSAVSMSVYVRVCVSGRAKSVCRAVELLTSDSHRPCKLSSNHCVLLSGLPRWQTLWKPEQALLRRGLTECFSNCHDCSECFLLGFGKYHISIAILKPPLSRAELVHACIISPCLFSVQRN